MEQASPPAGRFVDDHRAGRDACSTDIGIFSQQRRPAPRMGRFPDGSLVLSPEKTAPVVAGSGALKEAMQYYGAVIVKNSLCAL